MSTYAMWHTAAERMVATPLDAIRNDELLVRLPKDRPDRHTVASLETIGRITSGLAGCPDFQPGLAEAIHVGLDPSARDRFAFVPSDREDRYGIYQGLVDAAFLCLGLLRAPALWGLLSPVDQGRLIEGLVATQRRRAHLSNWLLFAGLIEAFLTRVQPDAVVPDRIDRALRQTMDWYLGDGVYGDGPHYADDYYNSYVIHPMLMELVDTVGAHDAAWAQMRGEIHRRARRYAESLERRLAPDGTFPVIGRSICYRFGALHHLAYMAAREDLPESLTPGSVRAAMSATLNRFMAADIVDAEGWLTIGFAGGDQFDLSEGYISRASVYGFCWGFHPLALSPDRPFWSDPEAPWTSLRAWSGQSVVRDAALPGG